MSLHVSIPFSGFPPLKRYCVALVRIVMILHFGKVLRGRFPPTAGGILAYPPGGTYRQGGGSARRAGGNCEFPPPGEAGEARQRFGSAKRDPASGARSATPLGIYRVSYTRMRTGGEVAFLTRGSN